MFSYEIVERAETEFVDSSELTCRSDGLARTVGGGISEVFASGVGQAGESLDHFGMLSNEVGRLARVGLQVVETESDLSISIGRRLTVGARWAGETAVLVGEVKLPAARTDGLELPAPIEVEGFVGTLGFGLGEEQGSDGPAIDGAIA